MKRAVQKSPCGEATTRWPHATIHAGAQPVALIDLMTKDRKTFSYSMI
jgi:hypothetical protein